MKSQCKYSKLNKSHVKRLKRNFPIRQICSGNKRLNIAENKNERNVQTDIQNW